MKKRFYNILFDLHTVAGIFISCLLFVMFFTGTISFLRDEIVAWERGQPVQTQHFQNIDFDKLIDSIQSKENLDFRKIQFSQYYNEENIGVYLSKPLDENQESAIQSRRGYFTINSKSGYITNYINQMTIGEIVYRLHFLAQLNFKGPSGYILAGFISLFFLIVLITGIYIHWDNMISHFYQFRAKGKWKIIWTDSHVTLGFISLPFQLIYAITGCTILLSSYAFIEPAVNYLYAEGEKSYYDGIKPYEIKSNEPTQDFINTTYAINSYVSKAVQLEPEVMWTDLEIENFNDQNMTATLIGHLPYAKDINSHAVIQYQIQDGKNTMHIKPNEAGNFADSLDGIVYRFHFGDFGGYPLKVIFILLGFISSYVIMSGVMIWHTARDNRKTSETKRKINYFLTKIYLSISLSVIPTIAFSLLVSRLFHYYHGAPGKSLISPVFFYSWGTLALVMICLRNFRQINLITLVLTAIFSLLIPIVHGFTNLWIWQTLNAQYEQLFAVDLFWLSLGLISLYAIIQIVNNSQTSKIT